MGGEIRQDRTGQARTGQRQFFSVIADLDSNVNDFTQRYAPSFTVSYGGATASLTFTRIFLNPICMCGYIHVSIAPSN